MLQGLRIILILHLLRIPQDTFLLIFYPYNETESPLLIAFTIAASYASIKVATSFLDCSVLLAISAINSSAIVNAISNGDSVSLYGFMKIERREKKEYVGHGFGTKDRKVIPAHGTHVSGVKGQRLYRLTNAPFY